MSSSKRVSWQKWPILAGVLAVLFIGAGITVLSLARTTQDRITHEIRLIDELDQLGHAIHKLGLVHRVETNSDLMQWEAERIQLNERVRMIAGRYADSPGMPNMPALLNAALARTDSLHWQAMTVRDTPSERAASDAVMQILLRRAQQVVDHTIRQVHEQGLAVNAASLADKWAWARLLLVAACLLAVAVAWLAGTSNRLLFESRVHTAQLDQAKRNLEHINKELRETMLSKEEKEVMIKEIHHRVKNNLQIVKSLIRFQMDQVKDAHTQELFNECVNRVSAMALVHEQTYLSKDLANIDVNSYLNALIRDLVHAYSVGVHLKMDVDIRVQTLSVDTLVPMGLLINEIISNSFKHAFKGRSTGSIIVHLSGSESEGLLLRIGDDGIGLPDKTKWSNPQSLGMDLIHTLAGQLDAQVELSDGPGTIYVLRPDQQHYRKSA
jgi:two-component sensor histidine kinase